MGWNGSGAFDRTQDFTADKNSGLPDSLVTAARMDDEFANFKTGLQNCLTRDGQNSPSANISLAGYKLTNAGTPTSGGDVANKTYVDGEVSDAITGLGGTITGLSTVTPSELDKLLIADVSDSNANKAVTIADVIALLSANGRLPQTGDVKFGAWSSAPAGWVLGFGTIGNAASSATNRANADTSALFTVIWNAFADAQAAVSGGRGASAAADYAANKTIAVPDLRGRVIAGLDNMGGSAASRLTNVISGLTGSTLGATGGDQRMQTHTHTASVTDAGHAHGVETATTSGGSTARMSGQNLGVNGNNLTGTAATVSATTGITVSNADAGAGSSQNVQPTMVLNVAIKL